MECFFIICSTEQEPWWQWPQLSSRNVPSEIKAFPRMPHALHVLGGLGPLVLTTRNAFKGRYLGSAYDRRGLIYCSMYWHFLDVAWVLLYCLLLWGMGS